jgi:sarcosine oxidase gamma subunit
VENTGTNPIHADIFERMQQTNVQPMEDYIDVVKVSPDHYTLLSHEGDVRVILMNLPASAEDALHSHYAESVYFLSGGNVIIQTNGKEIEAEIPDGYAMQNDGWTHRVKNTGTTPIKAIIFEQVPSGTRQ